MEQKMLIDSRLGFNGLQTTGCSSGIWRKSCVEIKGDMPLS
jgi:hypothetical protein